MMLLGLWLSKALMVLPSDYLYLSGLPIKRQSIASSTDILRTNIMLVLCFVVTSSSWHQAAG